MVHVMLISVLNILCFYINTLRRKCSASSITVFCILLLLLLGSYYYYYYYYYIPLLCRDILLMREVRFWDRWVWKW